MIALKAKDVMNRKVLAARDDMTLEELSGFLVEHEISGAPVEDRAGKLVGVVSVSDLSSTLSQGGRVERDRSSPDYFVHGWEWSLTGEELSRFNVHNGGSFVRDIMTSTILSVDEETPVSGVAQRMMEHHIHRLIVTRHARMTGIVTSSDLLGLLVERA